MHREPSGPGDARPTALQIIKDNDLIGQWKGKKILVTGGTNGLGLELVRQLARTGATVFFTARNAERAEQVKQSLLNEAATGDEKPILEVINLDLNSLEGVRRGAEEIKAKTDRLNIVINNAGQSRKHLGTPGVFADFWI